MITIRNAQVRDLKTDKLAEGRDLTAGELEVVSGGAVTFGWNIKPYVGTNLPGQKPGVVSGGGATGTFGWDIKPNVTV